MLPEATWPDGSYPQMPHLDLTCRRRPPWTPCTPVRWISAPSCSWIGPTIRKSPCGSMPFAGDPFCIFVAGAAVDRCSHLFASATRLPTTGGRQLQPQPLAPHRAARPPPTVRRLWRRSAKGETHSFPAEVQSGGHFVGVALGHQFSSLRSAASARRVHRHWMPGPPRATCRPTCAVREPPRHEPAARRSRQLPAGPIQSPLSRPGDQTRQAATGQDPRLGLLQSGTGRFTVGNRRGSGTGKPP